MPVLFDSSAQGTLLVAGPATSGSKTLTHNVSTLARDRVIAFVAVLWTGEVSTSGATFGVTFGGVSMTQIGSVSWDSNKGTLRLFKLEDVARGSKSVVASFSGMGTELITRNFMVASVTYSGVDEVGSVEDEGGSSTANNSVVVGSVKPAHRVLSVHGVGKLKALSAYNQSKRQALSMFGGGALIVGDAPGAETVTCTATNSPSTTLWGALGVAMTPSVVEIAASLPLSFLMKASATMFRVANPHYDREYTVLPAGQLSPEVITANGNFNRSGVWLPTWPKDTNDILEYTLRWDNFLADDDQIVSVQHTTSGSLRVFSEFPRHVNDEADDEATAILGRATTQVWLSGGTANVTHPVRVRFATLRGRQHDFTFWISGVEN